VNVLLVPAHPGFPGQIPQSRKTVVCVCVITVRSCCECTTKQAYQLTTSVMSL